MGKGGIVRDTALHDVVIADIEDWLVTKMKWKHLAQSHHRLMVLMETENFSLQVVKFKSPLLGVLLFGLDADFRDVKSLQIRIAPDVA